MPLLTATLTVAATLLIHLTGHFVLMALIEWRPTSGAARVVMVPQGVATKIINWSTRLIVSVIDCVCLIEREIENA